MNKTKRTTANLPEQLLKEAMAASGRGITETLIEGLKLVRRTRAYRLATELKGKIDFNIDINSARERPRR